VKIFEDDLEKTIFIVSDLERASFFVEVFKHIIYNHIICIYYCVLLKELKNFKSTVLIWYNPNSSIIPSLSSKDKGFFLS